MSEFIYTENIKKIHENVSNLKKRIEDLHLKNIEGKQPTLAVLLGGTGSGKSTFMHVITGRKLIVQETEHGKLILKAKEEWDLFKIGHGIHSETTVPGIYPDLERNIIFCDCPGFFDTNGPMQEIVNIFTIVALLNSIEKVKIILLATPKDATSLRGQNSRKQFGIIDNLSRNKFSQKGISMVITQADEKYKEKKNLNKLLGRMGAFDEKNKLMNMFAKEADDRVFIFPEPVDDDIDKEYDHFKQEDVTKFINFIKKDNDLFETNDKVPLNESSLLFILSMINSLDRMNSIIHEFVIQMINDYETEIEQSPEELDKWKNIVMNFKKKEYESLNNFSSELKEIFQKEEYQAIYKKIEHIQFLLSIFDKIDFNELNHRDASICRQFMKSVSNESITKNFQKELQVIENEIKNEERVRAAEKELHQEYEKRIEADQKKLQAENRADEIESQKKKLEEQRKVEEEKLKKVKEENKRQNAILRESEEKLRMEKAEQARIQEQNRFLKEQIEILKNRPSPEIIYEDDGGCLLI